LPTAQRANNIRIWKNSVDVAHCRLLVEVRHAWLLGRTSTVRPGAAQGEHRADRQVQGRSRRICRRRCKRFSAPSVASFHSTIPDQPTRETSLPGKRASRGFLRLAFLRGSESTRVGRWSGRPVGRDGRRLSGRSTQARVRRRRVVRSRLRSAGGRGVTRRRSVARRRSGRRPARKGNRGGRTVMSHAREGGQAPDQAGSGRQTGAAAHTQTDHC
jgi:hypothetical protein